MNNNRIQTSSARLRWLTLPFLLGISLLAMGFGLPLDANVSEPKSPKEILLQPLALPDAGTTTLLTGRPAHRRPVLSKITVDPGDTLTAIFDRLGLARRTLYGVLGAGSEAAVLERLAPGQVLWFSHYDDGQLSELIFATDAMPCVRIYGDSGVAFKIAPCTARLERHRRLVSGEIATTLARAARSAGLSLRLARRLQRLCRAQIELERVLQPGATFSVLHEDYYFAGEKLQEGDILAAELSTGEQRYRLVGFPDMNGERHFYTPDGRSLTTALDRYPIDAYQRVSSPFNPDRLHPVLGEPRPHTGTDFAASTGTSVTASGDGTLAFIDWQRGYGRTVIIDHGNGYSTLYAHLNRFAAGLTKGDTVRRGQPIGLVGQSGLTTGPNLHFEIRVDGIPRNPLQVALPAAASLTGTRLARFRTQVEPLLAQLDLGVRIRLAQR